MTDRGGLNYNFNINDGFSGPAKKFREELRKTKKAADDLRKSESGERSNSRLTIKKTRLIRNLQDATELLSDVEVRAAKTKKRLADADERAARPESQAKRAAEALKKQQRDKDKADKEDKARERAANQEAKKREAADKKKVQEAAKNRKAAAKLRADDAAREARELANSQRALKNFFDAKNKNEQTAAKISKQMRKDQLANDPQRRGAEQNRLASLGQETLRARIGQQRQAGIAALAAGDFKGFKQAQVEVSKLSRALNKTERDGNSLLFTFRRLVGVLAVFTLARKAVEGINALISSGLKFNDTIQNSTVGIAGLLSSLVEIRDASGQVVSAQDEFGLAMGLATEQVAALRQESLRTVATFEQLLETFQVSVGPGIAAGLNLDEIRKITVGISQAASALGVPQNQLAEEVRSLLSGTIQARTTRIATVLGISNADIKNLKESGTLFDVLSQKLEAFNIAAEKQARTSLSGITTLIKGALNEALGQASLSLFDGLIARANQFFDLIVTVRDEFGNLRPNPDFVAAFQPVFESLNRLLADISDTFSGKGVFSGQQSQLQRLKAIITAVSNTLEVAARFAAGFVNQIVTFIAVISRVLTTVSRVLGISVQGLGKLAAAGGLVLASFIALQKISFSLISGVLLLKDAFGLMNISLRASVVLFGKWLLVGIGIGVTIEAILMLINAIFGTSFSLIGVFKKAGSALSSMFRTSKDGYEDATAAADGLLQKQRDINAAVRQQAAKGDTFGAAFDPTKGFDASRATTGAKGGQQPILVTTARVLSDNAEALTELAEEADKAEKAFRLLDGTVSQGFAGELQKLTIDSLIKEEERLLKLTQERENLQNQIRANARRIASNRQFLGEVDAGKFEDSPEIAARVQAARQEIADLMVRSDVLRESRDSVVSATDNANDDALRLRAAKAAEIAKQTFVGLQEENMLSQAKLRSEVALNDAIAAGHGERAIAVLQAQSELNLAREQAKIEQTRLANEIADSEVEAAMLPQGEEKAAVEALIVQLKEKLLLEKGIADEAERALKAKRGEAMQDTQGTAAQGFTQGFQDLQDELPTRFEAGVNAMKGTVNGFAAFASQTIVEAFDPTNDTSLSEKFARFFQSIAQLYLEEFIKAEFQLAATRAATRAASGGAKGGVVKAGGFAQGGRVAQALARGYAKGGPLFGKAPGVSPKDTVPAWLQPGEFVVRKSVVDDLGLGFFNAVNGGQFDVAASPAALAANPSTGMALGGPVVDRGASQAASGGSSSGKSETRIVPAIVARDREMDTLVRGGSFAQMSWMRENASEINQALDRGPRRR